MDQEKELKKQHKLKINYLFPLLFAIILVVGILIGVLISGSPEVVRTSFFTKADHDKMEEILNYVSNRYVDTIDSQGLFNLAIDEIFKNLDPHSVYISAESLKDVTESLEGQFEGIGVEFFISQDTILVVTPIKDGPSEKAGIKAGDKIVLIEDSTVAGVSIANHEVIQKLKGPEGTEVKVAVLRKGEDSLLNYKIVRGPIKISSIESAYMMDKEIGYIKINKFSSTTDEDFKDALKLLKRKGMEKLVLDLRDNGGGYLEAATRVADELLSGRKLIVYTQGRAYPKKNYRAHKEGNFEEGDLVVLINENSASASEILAGAIQDWDRGTIMGRRSYGKALVQDQIRLKDGSAMRLTIARYYTPKGRSIQRPYENGVEEYHNDYFNRMISEYEQADSFAVIDTAEWGITPEVYLAHDTSLQYLTVVKLLNRGVIPRFVYNYYSNNSEQFAKYADLNEFLQNYTVSKPMFQKFLKFLEQEKEPFLATEVSRSSDTVKAVLKAYLSKQLFHNEGYYNVMNEIDHEVQAAYQELLRK